MLEIMETNSFAAQHAAWEPSCPGPAWLAELRREALGRFVEVGLPTPDLEEWRFTNVAPLAATSFALPPAADDLAVLAQLTDEALFGAHPGPHLVFCHGQLIPELSRSALDAGLVVGNLADHAAAAEKHLGQWAQWSDPAQAFVALNTAFLADGAYVAIPPGVTIAEPIGLVHLALPSAESVAYHPRNLIVLGKDARATIVECYHGLDGTSYLANAVTEVVLGDGAQLDHYKIQREGTSAFHIATLQVQQARTSQMRTHSIGLGGLIVRNDINVVLADSGSEATVNGLYFGTGKQLIDNHTRIDHAQPHCQSHELYKGILDGQARGVFNGKIYVHQDAQKTDAKQTNKTLLLSEDAAINSKPQLEIFADDVKCTHGATVGQLSEEQLFYLQSRGVGRTAARNLLTYAFANDIIGRCRIAPLRARLEEHVMKAQSLPREVEV